MMLTLSTLSDGDGDEIHYRVILYCTPPRIGSEAATATIEKAGGRSREREREVMPSCCCRWTRDHAASGGSNYRRLWRNIQHVIIDSVIFFSHPVSNSHYGAMGRNVEKTSNSLFLNFGPQNFQAL